MMLKLVLLEIYKLNWNLLTVKTHSLYWIDCWTIMSNHYQIVILCLSWANSFANFFINKVTRIRQELINVTSDNQVNSVGDNSTDTGIPSFDCFRPVSADDIEKTILGSGNKSCMLDTLPMWMFKDNVNIMCNVLMQLVNQSFSTGESPSQLREAIVCPVLKKGHSWQKCAAELLPNIRYYSKIMEKIAAAQLQDHLRANNLLEEFQSAYRAQHSTETALLRVKTDILTDMKRQCLLSYWIFQLPSTPWITKFFSIACRLLLVSLVRR